MAQTLDQKRAKFAWDAAKNANIRLKNFSDYKNLAKGAPALIMGNGLMSALAFYKSRGKDHSTLHHSTLLMQDILNWLSRVNAQYADNAPTLAFEAAMQAMQGADSIVYMRLTDEALAMLKWLRQFADSVGTSDGD